MASGSFYTSLKPKLRVSPFGSRSSIYRVTHAFSRTLFVLVERSLTLRYNLSLSRVWSMASVAGTAITIPAWPRRQSLQVFNGLSGLKLVSFSSKRKSFPLIQLHPSPMCFRVSCAAKQETLKKVCGIVKKQLALPEGTSVTGESKFATLGADSLDTVEIVMGLEEAFGINVEEESAQSIVTVQDAADLIEKLIKEKSG